MFVAAFYILVEQARVFVISFSSFTTIPHVLLVNVSTDIVPN